MKLKFHVFVLTSIIFTQLTIAQKVFGAEEVEEVVVTAS